MGYFECMYALNAAHSEFTKLYKTVFLAGLDRYCTPAPSHKVVGLVFAVSRVLLEHLVPQRTTIAGSSSASSVASTTAPAPAPAQGRGLFGRWGASTASLLSTRSTTSTFSQSKSKPSNNSTLDLEKADRERKERERPAEGAVEEMIVGGAAGCV
ncbi:hypothetical protein K438DRAFT_1970029 [Mycena galopus ATCC 62051]|nr:hypothetical protein K438DRAFT_1970029 [Mycena galopus ATCC 62051]